MKRLLALLLPLVSAVLQAQGTRVDVRSVTVADLPATCTAGRIYNVRDGASGTDCSTGGGSTAVWCVCDAGGSSYTGYDPSAAGGGSGDVTDVGDCSTGACFTADGTGNALVFEGTTADLNELTLSAADPGSDLTLTLPAATDTLVGRATTDTLTNKTINTASNTITVVEADISDLSHTTDTTLSQEQVEDLAGAMVTGNTETRIAVTYQDADGTFDFVVDDMNDDVPESGDFGAAADLEATGALSIDTVGLDELAACPGTGQIVEYGASGVPSCISTPSGGSGDVTGPASSTDNEIPRFDGTGGKTLQTSGLVIDDTTAAIRAVGDDSGEGVVIDFSDGGADNPLTLTDSVCADGPCLRSVADDLYLYASDNRLYWYTRTSPTALELVQALVLSHGTDTRWSSDSDTYFQHAGDRIHFYAGGRSGLDILESASVVTVTIEDAFELDPQSVPPVTCAAGTEGTLYADSDSNELCYCDGTSWTGLKAGGTCA